MSPARNCPIRPSRRSGRRPRSWARWCIIHPNGFTEGAAAVALLFQQHHRQSVRDHARAALPDLRRRAGAPSEAEDLRHAWRRLSRRLFRPHRPRLGRALGLPGQSAEAADRLSEEDLFRHRGVHAACSSKRWSRPSASTTSSWAPTIPSTCWNTIRSANQFGRELRRRDPRGARRRQCEEAAGDVRLRVQKIQHRGFRDHRAVGAVHAARACSSCVCVACR